MAVAIVTTLSLFHAQARVVRDSEIGTTHNHPISHDQTLQYLQEYLGAFVYNTNDVTEWYFSATKVGNNIIPDEPLATQPGDVIFVEVNDYWKGTDWTATPNIYNQVKYGVKSINKVNQGTQIGNGSLYHYHATTNRFFFAVRTSNFYIKNKKSGKSDANWIEYSSGYYLKDTLNLANDRQNYNYKPFRWYNELSAVVGGSSYGWDDLSASYDNLKDGAFNPVPHSCGNSLEKNHFTTLRDKNVVDEPYSADVMLFVPTGTNAIENFKNTEYTTGNIPQVFFYVNSLSGKRVAAASTASKYAINLNWETSFDKAQKNPDIVFTQWNNRNGGVKEESHIYRKIEGENSFSEVYIENGLVDLKTWTDRTLPFKEDGYDVEYYVVTYVITYNASGERTGEEIVNAPTNHVTFHIPNSGDSFEIVLTNNFNSTYKPKANNINNSYNRITNTVKATANDRTPSLSSIKEGDTFTLYREEEGKGRTVVSTLEITKIDVSNGFFGWGKSTTYSYKCNNTSGSSKDWTETQNILNLLTGTDGYTETLDFVPGKLYDAQYQLIYKSGQDELRSNVVSAHSLRTDVQTEKVYRSGTPDPEKNAAKELYTVNVRFKPIISDKIAYYNIWRNAEEKVVRIGQFGTSFVIIGKDEQDNFNVEMGPAIVDEDGYINVPIDHAMDKHVCDYENGNYQSHTDNDLFFTVEVCATGNNSYGNSDKASGFVGDPSELVLNTYGMFYQGDETRPGQYRAEISWEKIKTKENISADDYVAADPDYYTVYRCATTGDAHTFEPVTQFWRHYKNTHDDNGNFKEESYKLVDMTSDGTAYKFTPELIEQVLSETGDENFSVIDFITDKSFVPTSTNIFPAIYYVQAHFESPFKKRNALWMADSYYSIQNYIEKNSNPTRASAVVVTGVSENKVSEVVSTTYYSILGYPVTNPEPGQIVIVQHKHANGEISAKVMKF